MSDTSWSYGWAFYKTGRSGKPPADIPAFKRRCSEECLKTAEALLNEAAFNRWPSVPVRGFGGGKLRIEPFVAVLPDAANGESRG